MTKEQIIAQIEMLNPRQRGALRHRFYGQKIEYLRCEVFLGHVRDIVVGFASHLRSNPNPIFYRVVIGPRGGMERVECLGSVI